MYFKSTVLFCILFVSCTSIDDELAGIEMWADEHVFDEDSMIDIVNEVNKKSHGTPDSKVGEKVANWNPRSRVNPEELGSYYQGDILNTADDTLRNGIIGDQFRWPRGIVYYRIGGNFDRAQLLHISRAMRMIEQHSCIHFRKYTGTQRDYVTITSERNGCWASVGRSGGDQQLNMQTPNCFRRFGTMIHELLHVLGFMHEHSRIDRDDYVRIEWINMQPDAIGQFEKENTHAFGFAYDYGSVLHYSAFAFSKNRKPTIIPKRTGPYMGQRVHLSLYDILKLNAMYKCQGKVSLVT